MHDGMKVLKNGQTYVKLRLDFKGITNLMCRGSWGTMTFGKLKSWLHRQPWLRLMESMAFVTIIIGLMANCCCSIRWSKCWLSESLICLFACVGPMRTGAGGGTGVSRIY